MPFLIPCSDPSRAALTICVLFFVCIVRVPFEVGIGQETSHEDEAYVRVTNERAQKIVARLELNDPAKAPRIRDQIARFYRDLHAIHAERDSKLKSGSDEQVSFARTIAESKQFQLHFALLGRLGAELNGDEIEKVKDGLTYEVVPKTLQQYRMLHPNLTGEQQRSIHALLLEAREHAMDAGSSEEKHAIFGKYKGRINNYLSAEGYDAKKAELELRGRQAKQ